MTMKLVDDVRAVCRHYSTRALAALTGVSTAWVSIPESIKSGLPDYVGQTVAWIVLAVAIFGLGAKFVDQKDAPAPPADAP